MQAAAIQPKTLASHKHPAPEEDYFLDQDGEQQHPNQSYICLFFEYCASCVDKLPIVSTRTPKFGAWIV